jgi:cytochrome c oxidase assembly protein subunit 15
VIRRGEVLLIVLLMQGGVGYLQYFSGVPAWLVAIHVALAATLWAVTVQFALGLTDRPAIGAGARQAATVGSTVGTADAELLASA